MTLVRLTSVLLFVAALVLPAARASAQTIQVTPLTRADRVLVSSFHLPTIDRVHDLDGSVPTGFLVFGDDLAGEGVHRPEGRHQQQRQRDDVDDHEPEQGRCQQQGQALAIGLTSYDGGVYFGLNADRNAMPDLEVLGQCIVDALAELTEGREGA